MAIRLQAGLRALLPVVACGVGLLLAACSSQTQPQTTQSRALDSGVTSSNGGGMAPANFGTSAPVRAR